jgi:hypothetical protein
LSNIYQFRLALKCCEHPEDFAFCHGNRAAALMKIGFNKVARYDCEEALRFSHPDPFKIYQRLCSLSQGNFKEMVKNVAGLEKYLKPSSKQSKEILQQYKVRLKAMEKEMYVDNLPNIEKLDLESDLVKQ